MTLIEYSLMGVGGYVACGFCFALYFVTIGVGKIDPHAVHGSWGFRLLILPGSVMLWPILAKRVLRGQSHPPVERTAHRQQVIGGTER